MKRCARASRWLTRWPRILNLFPIFTSTWYGPGSRPAPSKTVLDRLADYGESQAELLRKVRGALTYPMIMMVVGTAIMGFLVTYVIPQVSTVFAQTVRRCR